MALRANLETFRTATLSAPPAAIHLKAGTTIRVGSWCTTGSSSRTSDLSRTGTIKTAMTKKKPFLTIEFDGKEEELCSSQLFAMGYECLDSNAQTRGGDWASTALHLTCQDKDEFKQLPLTPYEMYCDLVDGGFSFESVTEKDIFQPRERSPVYCLLQPRKADSAWSNISQYLIQEDDTQGKVSPNLVPEWKKFVLHHLVPIHRHFYKQPAPESSWFGATQAAAKSLGAHYVELAQERLQASVAIIREAHGCFVKGAEELVKCGGQAMSLYLEPKNTQVTCVTTPLFSQEMREMAGGSASAHVFQVDRADNSKSLRWILQQLLRQMSTGTDLPLSNHPSYRPPPPPPEAPPPDSEQNLSGAASHQWLLAFDSNGSPYWYDPGEFDSEGIPMCTRAFPRPTSDMHSAPAASSHNTVRDTESPRSRQHSGPSEPPQINVKERECASIISSTHLLLESKFERGAYAQKATYKIGKPGLSLYMKKAIPGLTISARPSLPWDEMNRLLKEYEYAAFHVPSEDLQRVFSAITGLDLEVCKEMMTSLPRTSKAQLFDAVREDKVKDVKVYASGAHGYDQARGTPPPQTRRGGRNSVFGRELERVTVKAQQEARGAYIRRTSSQSTEAALMRIESGIEFRFTHPWCEADGGGMDSFCSLPSGCEQLKRGICYPNSASIMHIDEGSVIDPHCMDLSNRTIVVLSGSIVVLLWKFSACQSLPQFVSGGYHENLDIFSDCRAFHELLEKDGYPTVLKITQGNAVVIRSGCRAAWIATENSVMCEIGWCDLQDREQFSRIVSWNKGHGRFDDILIRNAKSYMLACRNGRRDLVPEEYRSDENTVRLEFLSGFFLEVLLGITTRTWRPVSRVNELLIDLSIEPDDLLATLRNLSTNELFPAESLGAATLTAFCSNPPYGFRGEVVLKLIGISLTKEHTRVQPLIDSTQSVDCHDGADDSRMDDDCECLVFYWERPRSESMPSHKRQRII